MTLTEPTGPATTSSLNYQPGPAVANLVAAKTTSEVIDEGELADGLHRQLRRRRDPRHRRRRRRLRPGGRRRRRGCASARSRRPGILKHPRGPWRRQHRNVHRDRRPGTDERRGPQHLGPRGQHHRGVADREHLPHHLGWRAPTRGRAASTCPRGSRAPTRPGPGSATPTPTRCSTRRAGPRRSTTSRAPSRVASSATIAGIPWSPAAAAGSRASALAAGRHATPGTHHGRRATGRATRTEALLRPTATPDAVRSPERAASVRPPRRAVVGAARTLRCQRNSATRRARAGFNGCGDPRRQVASGTLLSRGKVHPWHAWERPATC